MILTLASMLPTASHGVERPTASLIVEYLKQLFVGARCGHVCSAVTLPTISTHYRYTVLYDAAHVADHERAKYVYELIDQFITSYITDTAFQRVDTREKANVVFTINAINSKATENVFRKCRAEVIYDGGQVSGASVRLQYMPVALGDEGAASRNFHLASCVQIAMASVFDFPEILIWPDPQGPTMSAIAKEYWRALHSLRGTGPVTPTAFTDAMTSAFPVDPARIK